MVLQYFHPLQFTRSTVQLSISSLFLKENVKLFSITQLSSDFHASRLYPHYCIERKEAKQLFKRKNSMNLIKITKQNITYSFFM